MQIQILLFAVMPSVLSVQGPSLESLKDNHRVLLVFTPSDRDPAFRLQSASFKEQQAAMNERDLVLVVGNTSERKRFKVAPEEFAVILIGKDGGEKMRSHQPVTAEKLEQTIDAMPMRRDEMSK